MVPRNTVVRVRTTNCAEIHSSETLLLSPLPQNTPGMSHSKVSYCRSEAGYKCKHSNLASNRHLLWVLYTAL